MNFTELWTRIRYSSWFSDLPEWLREPPGLYIAAGILLFLILFAVYQVLRFLVRLAGRGGGGNYQASFRKGLEQEIRELRKVGDWLGVGQRYETLGKVRAALDAYGKGGHGEESAQLLLKHNQRDKAKRVAQDFEVWELYGDLCREDGEHAEAASAYEKGGKLYDAARSWQEAGEAIAAARCYTAVDLEANAAQLLMKGDGPEVAQAMDSAIRSSLKQARGDAMSPEMAAAVRRGAQLWLAQKAPERAYSLALASQQWAVAAPIARDYLEPKAEMAEVCRKAGDLLAAAEIYRKLGDEIQENKCRGEHFLLRDDAASAAPYLEKAEAWEEAAEAWARAGQNAKAAELFARGERFDEAAKLYATLGDPVQQQAMEAASRSHDPISVLEAELDDATRALGAPSGATQVARPGESTPPPPPADERYRLGEVLGRGGMGVVYRATDTILEREVAYKVLSPEITQAGSEEADSLISEAKAAAKLSHPNIVQVYDAGRVGSGSLGGGYFVVMELVEGHNFAELLRKKRLSVPGVVTVGRQICAALDHAHRKHIVHRDLKPSNLMWTEEKQIKLTDFGLARQIDSNLGEVQTRAAGTPYYMAPEQIRGEAVSPQTDIYSLGCVLFEMLCQRAPFASGGSLYHHLNTPPEDPRTTRQEIPGPMAQIILACLQKEASARPRSAAAVAQSLASI